MKVLQDANILLNYKNHITNKAADGFIVVVL